MSKEIRHVFIDTTEIVAANFSFDSDAFLTLTSLCRAQVVQVITTDITTSEITSRVKLVVAEAASALRSASRKARVLRPLKLPEFSGLFEKFDEAAICESVGARIKSFLKATNAIVLPAASGNASRVFEAYFAKKPPFGEGKKKAEFPDAFVGAALLKWCDENDAAVAVVSHDGDVKALCAEHAQLEHVESLAMFVESTLSDENASVAVAHSRFDRHQLDIQARIAATFRDQGFYLDDADGDVEGVDVKDLELDEVAVVGVTGERASFVAEAQISFSADVSYGAPDSSYYDSEDKAVHYREAVNTTLERECRVPVTFALVFALIDHSLAEVEDIRINNDESITFSVDESDY